MAASAAHLKGTAGGGGGGGGGGSTPGTASTTTVTATATAAAAATAATAAGAAPPVAAAGGWPAGLKPPSASAMYVEHGAPAGTPTRTVQSGRTVVRTTYSDGVERVDEWDGDGSAVVARRWRGRSALGREGAWEYEFGEAAGGSGDAALAGAGGGAGSGGAALVEAGSSPVVYRRNTPAAWEFRIRNLFWPIETYALAVNDATQQIVLRTSNKKYYKTLDLPALWRARIPLDARALSMEHAVSTLVIRYAKPPAVVATEASERRDVRALLAAGAREGDVACKTQ